MLKDKFDATKALDFEASKRVIEEKSLKVAWIIALTMTVITVLLVIAIIIMLPLKSKVPFMVKVDQSNGAVDIVPILKEKTITTSEATDKHFVNQYVIKRESYYHDLLDSDYVTVQAMSSDRIAQEYRKIYEGETGRAEVYKDNFLVEVNIKSIVLGVSAGTKIATIRADIMKKDLKTKYKSRPVSKVITLSYTYIPSLIQKEKLRLNNPLGFQVMTYRTDNEVR